MKHFSTLLLSIVFSSICLGQAALEADINPNGDSEPRWLTVYNGELYFSANHPDYGVELWKFNGSIASLVSDIYPGSESSSPEFLTVSDGLLCFSANDGTNGTELWVYDGTSLSLYDLNDAVNNGIEYSSSPSALTVFQNKLYFRAKGWLSPNVNQYGLWSFDGTSPQFVTEGYSTGTTDSRQKMGIANGKLYYSAELGGSGTLVDLASFDGTNQETAIIDYAAGGSPYYPVEFNGGLFFGYGELLSLDNGNNFSEAANINTEIIAGIESGSAPKYLTIYDGELYFAAEESSDDGRELWKYDGNSASVISDIHPNGAANVKELTVFDNKLFFWGQGDGTGDELWYYDGTNVFLAADIRPGVGGSFGAISGQSLEGKRNVEYNGRLFFSASDGQSGYELWSFGSGGGNSGNNDDCGDANSLSVNGNCISTQGDGGNATESMTDCTGNGNANDDVWYSFVAPGNEVTVEVTGSSGYDAVLEVFSGSCGSLTSLGCIDQTLDGGTEAIDMSSLVSGNTYYVRVYDYYTSATTTTFDICVHADGVGIADAEFENLSIYPNPTTGAVRIDLGQVAEDIMLIIYSPVGALVRTETLNGIQYVDQQLEGANGVYLLQLIDKNGTTASYKVLKQ